MTGGKILRSLARLAHQSYADPMTTRIAAVLAALLLTGALVATFAPTSAHGSSCGTWVAPEYDRERTAELIARGSETADDLERLGADGSNLTSMGNALAATTIACDDQLDGRRLLALILLGLAVAAPAGIIYIGRAKKLSSI